MTEGASTLPNLEENIPNSVFTSKLAPGADIGVGLVILSIVLLSISGNGLVLIISYRRRKKITGSELLCVNLAVVDFFCCICFYPLSILSSFSHSWLGLHPTCTYYGLGCYIFGLCGMFTIAAISVIRYLKTCYSLVYAWLDGANICLVCVGLWVIAALWSCLPLFGWGEYSPEPYGLSCTVAWRGYHTSTKDALYVICSFAVFTLVPVLLIMVSQCQILLKICHFSHSLSARGIRTNLRRAERRLSMMFFCISLGFVMAWAPYAVVSFLFIFNKDLGNMDPVGFVLPALFAKSSHVYNPFIYFYFNKSFKQELCSLLQAVFPWMNGNRVGVRVSSAPQAPHPIQIQLQDKHQPLALKGSLGFSQDRSNGKQKISSQSGLRLQGRVIYPCWIDEIRDSGSTLEHRPVQQSLPIPT